MNSSQIIAKYKGADGSLGYRTGTIYVLDMLPGASWVKIREGLTGSSPVAIRRKQSWFQRLLGLDDGFCPYSTREAFHRNWQVLEV